MGGSNFAKTFMLIAAMTAVFGGVGLIVGGEAGMVVALMVAAGMNLFTYWNADSIILRLYRARPVDAHTQPDFHGLVQDLARRADMPMPAVYIIDSAQPNAFATGRNPHNAAVAATTGLLSLLTRQEVAGVMAHELAHVRNRDTLTMTITATLAGAISMLTYGAMILGGGRSTPSGSPLGGIGLLLAAVLAPLAATVVQMAISRNREYEADRIGAQICGHPEWLAAALEKIERGARAIDNHAAEDNPATAHLFIINPLHARAVDGLFSTHPNTANRITALRRLAAAQPAASRSRPLSSPASRAAGRRRRPWG